MFINFIYGLLVLILMVRILEFTDFPDRYNPRIRFIKVFKSPTRLAGLLASCSLLLWFFLYPVADVTGIIGIIGLFAVLQTKWKNFILFMLISFFTSLMISIIVVTFALSGNNPGFHIPIVALSWITFLRVGYRMGNEKTWTKH